MKTAILGAFVAASALCLPASAQDRGSENQLSDPRSAFEGSSGKAWHAEVARTERGHIIGNPEAEAALIEFISYTCTDCAAFARQGEGALDLALLAPGHLTLEVRPVIRNALDLTISLLVQCGEPSGFKDRHRMFLMRQDTWLSKAQSAPAGQRAIWERGGPTARLNAAQALDFDDMLIARGVPRVEINRCLRDNRAAQALIENGDADGEEFENLAVPSFALDGELLANVHTWDALYPVIVERFRPDRAQ